MKFKQTNYNIAGNEVVGFHISPLVEQVNGNREQTVHTIEVSQNSDYLDICRTLEASHPQSLEMYINIVLTDEG